MKKLKNILSIALAAALMLMPDSGVFAAPVLTFEYDKELCFEDFESIPTGAIDSDAFSPLIHITNKTTLANKIGEDDGNKFFVFAKTEDNTVGNYIRINKVGKTPVDGTIQAIYGTNMEPLSQVQLSVDFYVVDRAVDFSIVGFYFDGNSLKSANIVRIIDKTFTIGANSTTVKINENAWYSLSLTLNFVKDVFTAEIRERGKTEKAGVFMNKSIPNDLRSGLHSFAFYVDDKATNYEVRLDNMKYAVPSAHITEYASDLAKLDFEEKEEGYEMVTDEVAIPAEATQSYYTYKKFGKYPGKIKAEANIRREEAGETTLYFGDTPIMTLAQNLVWVGGFEALTTDSEWINVTLYMDFETRKYDVLMYGGVVAVDADIPADITSPEGFKIGVDEGTLLVDYMKVSTLAPYESGKITGYLDENGEFEYGYVVNNPDSVERTYNIFRTKYDANGKYTGVEEITSETVAPGTMEIHTIVPSFATDGGYYRYFMFDANNLKPLN